MTCSYFFHPKTIEGSYSACFFFLSFLVLLVLGPTVSILSHPLRPVSFEGSLRGEAGGRHLRRLCSASKLGRASRAGWPRTRWRFGRLVVWGMDEATKVWVTEV